MLFGVRRARLRLAGQNVKDMDAYNQFLNSQVLKHPAVRSAQFDLRTTPRQIHHPDATIFVNGNKFRCAESHFTCGLITIILLAVVVTACAARPSLEELEQQALASGDWQAVESREEMMIRRAQNSAPGCPRGQTQILRCEWCRNRLPLCANSRRQVGRLNRVFALHNGRACASITA